MDNRKASQFSAPLAAAASMAVLWGVGLFGVFEVDVWTTKVLIVSALAPISFGLERFFYSC